MTTTTAEPLILTADEVSALFGIDAKGKRRVSTRTVQRHWKTIPGAFRMGNKLLFKRAPLMAWFDDVSAGRVIPFARAS